MPRIIVPRRDELLASANGEPTKRYIEYFEAISNADAQSEGDVSDLEQRVTQNEGDIANNTNLINSHVTDPSGAHAASAISFNNITSGLSANDVQAALDELDSDVDVNEQAIALNAANILLRARWRGAWTPGTYELNDMVEDAGWLMIANKQTQDKAAPVPEAQKQTTLPDVNPPFVTNDNPTVISSGHTYTLLEDGIIEAVRVWVPEVLGYVHRLVVYDLRDPANPKVILSQELEDLSPNLWNVISIQSVLLSAGAQFSIQVISDASTTATTFDGSWIFEGSVSTSPLPGFCSFNRAGSRFRVHNTDFNSVDRQAELVLVEDGATIELVNPANPGVEFATYLVTGRSDQGDFQRYDIVPLSVGAPITDGATIELTFTLPDATTTDYVRIDNNWVTQPSFVNVVGFLEFGGQPQIGEANTAFGVDFIFREYVTSPDWDFMSVSSGSGAGGGSGEINTASNLPGDEGVFAQKSNADLQFKSLTAGANVTLTSTADAITIESAAAATTGAGLVDGGTFAAVNAFVDGGSLV